MNFTEQMVNEYSEDFCFFRDNLNTGRREAVSIHDQQIKYSIAAQVLLQMSHHQRVEILGDIGDAPWGKLSHADL